VNERSNKCIFSVAGKYQLNAQIPVYNMNIVCCWKYSVYLIVGHIPSWKWSSLPQLCLHMYQLLHNNFESVGIIPSICTEDTVLFFTSLTRWLLIQEESIVWLCQQKGKYTLGEKVMMGNLVMATEGMFQF